MNNEDLLRMAKEAGFSGVDGLILCGNKSDLKKFTALVQAATAEEIAKSFEPKSPRPCDCDSCYCGNPGDHAAVVSWDSDSFMVHTIRTKYQDQTKSSGENNG